MMRAIPSFVKFFSVALFALSSAAMAADAPAKADAAKGAALFANGDAARGVIACASCHGAGGNSVIAQNPKLAAQHEAYVNKQLHDFTGATRQNPIMSGIAKALTEDDIKAIAAYVSAQKVEQGTAKNMKTVALGMKIFRGGIAEKNVPACAGCHSPNGAGIPAQYPRLAGQHQDYTAAQLTAFRSGTRSNSAQMTAVAKRMSDEEIQAVADYVAGLK